MFSDNDEKENQRWRNFLYFNFFGTDKERDALFEHPWFSASMMIIAIIIVAVMVFYLHYLK